MKLPQINEVNRTENTRISTSDAQQPSRRDTDTIYFSSRAGRCEPTQFGAYCFQDAVGSRAPGTHQTDIHGQDLSNRKVG